MAGRSRSTRRDDPKPLGDILDDETDHQERAEGDLAYVEGCPDGQPFAQVVQTDAGSDHIGQRQPLGGFAAPAGCLAFRDRIQQQEGADCADANQPDALKSARDEQRPAPALR